MGAEGRTGSGLGHGSTDEDLHTEHSSAPLCRAEQGRARQSGAALQHSTAEQDKTQGRTAVSGLGSRGQRSSLRLTVGCLLWWKGGCSVLTLHGLIQSKLTTGGSRDTCPPASGCRKPRLRVTEGGEC